MHENVQRAKCLTHCTFTCTRETFGTLHVYMHMMCACKVSVIRQPDAFTYLGSGPVTDVCMTMCSEPSV